MNPLDWSHLKTRYRGRLPHWELPGMTVFLTFRLADSLPRPVLNAYLAERRALDRLLRLEPESEELHRERARLFGRHVDCALDRGEGACALRHPDLARKTLDTLRHRDGEEYLLHAAVVMPNHVHAVATLAPEVDLPRVTQAWKSVTAHFAAKSLGLAMPLWQEESYDHIVRNERALGAVRRYIADNPRKAGLGGWPWVYERNED